MLFKSTYLYYRAFSPLANALSAVYSTLNVQPFCADPKVTSIKGYIKTCKNFFYIKIIFAHTNLLGILIWITGTISCILTVKTLRPRRSTLRLECTLILQTFRTHDNYAIFYWIISSRSIMKKPSFLQGAIHKLHNAKRGGRGSEIV